MESLELKGLRISKGKTQTDMAIAIEKSTDSYAKKERGEVLFSPEEMAIQERQARNLHHEPLAERNEGDNGYSVRQNI